jgi:hypothetical protein
MHNHVRSVFIAALAAVVALSGQALAQTNTMDNMHNSMSAHSINIQLAELNKSGQNGSATVTDVTGGVMVKVSVKNEPAGASEPAHIHEGTCAKLNPAPWKPLNNVVNGVSSTMVKGVTVAQIKGGHYAINVHKSAAELAHYVSCGDL